LAQCWAKNSIIFGCRPQGLYLIIKMMDQTHEAKRGKPPPSPSVLGPGFFQAPLHLGAGPSPALLFDLSSFSEVAPGAIEALLDLAVQRSLQLRLPQDPLARDLFRLEIEAAAAAAASEDASASASLIPSPEDPDIFEVVPPSPLLSGRGGSNSGMNDERAEAAPGELLIF
jgi:hypothetical protein